MESETIDISSENDVSVVTKAATISIKRRSSIFRPNEEDYDRDASEEEWPKEYKENLQHEEMQWKKLYNLSYNEYKEIRKQSKELPIMKVDKTMLDKQQQEFLDQGPSREEYLNVVEEFSNQLLLCHALHALNSKAKEVEREYLLSKINLVENMLLKRLTCD